MPKLVAVSETSATRQSDSIGDKEILPHASVWKQLWELPATNDPTWGPEELCLAFAWVERICLTSNRSSDTRLGLFRKVVSLARQ